MQRRSRMMRLGIAGARIRVDRRRRGMGGGIIRGQGRGRGRGLGPVGDGEVRAITRAIMSRGLRRCDGEMGVRLMT